MSHWYYIQLKNWWVTISRIECAKLCQVSNWPDAYGSFFHVFTRPVWICVSPIEQQAGLDVWQASFDTWWMVLFTSYRTNCHKRNLISKLDVKWCGYFKTLSLILCVFFFKPLNLLNSTCFEQVNSFNIAVSSLLYSVFVRIYEHCMIILSGNLYRGLSINSHTTMFIL